MFDRTPLTGIRSSHWAPTTPRATCTLWQNPMPIGWGDHIRWQHESGTSRATVGERHALARREASRLRSLAYGRMFMVSEKIARRLEGEDVFVPGLGLWMSTPRRRR